MISNHPARFGDVTSNKYNDVASSYVPISSASSAKEEPKQLTTTDQLDDEQLMMAVSQLGDMVAFRQLYDRYAAIVMGLTTKILGDRTLAEEIVQETFWRVWRNASSFDASRGSFKTWMFGISRNLSIDSLRRYKRTTAHHVEINDTDDGLGLEDLVEAPHNVAEDAWLVFRHQHIKDALNELPAEQRDVVIWIYFQGKTRRQIAQEEGIPFGTINTRARLALKKLRDALTRMGIED